MTPVSKEGTSQLSSGGAGGGGGVVVVAVGWGGRVHFYMIHLPVSPGSFGPLKVGVKKFMILPLTFL